MGLPEEDVLPILEDEEDGYNFTDANDLGSPHYWALGLFSFRPLGCNKHLADWPLCQSLHSGFL